MDAYVPQPYPRPTYQRLSQTGLYSNIATMTVASDALAYQPVHQLWSDDAAKRRWIQLPAGARIDTSDMDHWRFPIGTKVWKEFSRGNVLVETRLIERYGDGEDDFFMGAFIWSLDRQDATLAVDGSTNVNGTTHDVPTTEQCGECHRGEPGRILGVSAIQLSGASPGLSLAALSSANRLSQPPAAAGYPVPGDATTAAAFGYMHANCGTCHAPDTDAWHITRVDLRLRVGGTRRQPDAAVDDHGRPGPSALGPSDDHQTGGGGRSGGQRAHRTDVGARDLRSDAPAGDRDRRHRRDPAGHPLDHVPAALS